MLLDRMSPVDDAHYNSRYSTTIKRRGCTAETREKILEDLKEWVGDPDGAKVYWMNGMAGTGKTTILYSLCEWLAKNRRLGGDYFCSRITPLCRDANNIVPTIAYQLAQYSPAFRSALCKVLDQEPNASKLEIRWQFMKLVQEPMQAVKDAIPEDIVVVIDGLDECDTPIEVQLFLETLLKMAADLPIKFFVTSRPEPAIRSKMLGPGYSPSILHLHDIEESIVEADIKKYLVEALSTMSPPPSPDNVEQLAKQAGKLFIYAATAVRYIYPGDYAVNSGSRMKTMLGMASGSTKKKGGKQQEELDGLYSSVLSAAFDENRLEEDEVNDMHTTLRTAICAKEPITIRTLASLVALPEEQVQISLQPLRSLLHVQEGVHGLVSPFHASFPDYILDKIRSKTFYCDATGHNEVLTNGCFDVMKAELRFNICNLESSFLFDENVTDLKERINESISAALSYACRYWSEHFRNGNLTKAVHQKLVDFLRKRLLFWMEVLNLERRIVMAAEILHDALDRMGNAFNDTRKQLADAEAFVIRFTAGTCTRSTPHIYISVLPFCPRSSSVYQNYWAQTRGLIDVKGSGVELLRNPGIGTWATNSVLKSVAFSPDGTRIVSGSEDKTIRVWEARTGDAIAASFKGHTNWVNSVAFSPDGTSIVSGSSDHTIRVWDAVTGDPIAPPFQGHTGVVNSVAFSSDGTRIVSGSWDKTIRLWDARTGDAIGAPFEGHTNPVNSVAFSPDGTRIASGSYDNTVRVWDARTGDALTAPLKGHTNPVNSVAFSPDGTRIVSGSWDKTIRVWDACTGDAIGTPLKGHANLVNSVAFSPNGTHIVSSSWDKTIRVWDARTGVAIASPFQGHTNWVNSVAFSPDGTRIVSGADDNTIRVWEAPTDDAIAAPLYGHTDLVNSVAFSPDGRRIVSGSVDKSIRVWDARTGEVIAASFEGHTDSVNSVAISPDGTRIVSGSEDSTIRLWDAFTGDSIAASFQGHTRKINSVAFSPDGTHIVSGSWDNTIRVWDARTGDAIAPPFKGHTNSVKSVAFSPDGTRIVSGSCDYTIRIWDALTGDAIVAPFEGHTNSVTSVAFSPDGTRIVSGSDDNTIRVWDARSGDAIATSFEGHTGDVHSVAFSPDGTRIVSGSEDNTIRIWDASTGDAVAPPFQGHANRVYSVAFSPDGTHIVSGSADKSIRVWDARIGEATPGPFTSIPIDDSHLPSDNSPYVDDFTFTGDGWITANDVPLFWVPPYFHSNLPHPRNVLLIGSEGITFVDYHDLIIGKSWSKCYIR